MVQQIVISCIAMLLWLHPVAGYASPWEISASDMQLIKRLEKLASAKNWKEVRKEALKASNNVIPDIYFWREAIRGSEYVTFNEISSFLKKNKGLPRYELLLERTEEAMEVTTPTDDVLSWFRNGGASEKDGEFITPLTAKGKLHLAEALIQTDEKKYDKLIRSLLEESWIHGIFSKADEQRFWDKHQKRLTQNGTFMRISRLIWDGEYSNAKRLMPYVDNEARQLFNARMGLRQRVRNVDHMVDAVSKRYVNDEGLIYDRIRWREKNKQTKGILSLVKQQPKNKFRPKEWWQLNRKYIRAMLTTNNHSMAYRLIANHGFNPETDTKDFAEAEWMAGWLALRQIKRPRDAYRHFYIMYQHVETPISLGRAAYWAGRAAEDNNNQDIANQWYLEGSRYPTSFYGQLATEKTGSNTLKVTSEPLPTTADIKAFHGNRMVMAAFILHKAGHRWWPSQFLRAAVLAAPTNGEKFLISMFGLEIGRPDLSILTAKESTKNGGTVFPTAHYPTMILKDSKGKPIKEPEAALVHSIMKQESLFIQDIRSHAGALGLMQLMPATAQSVAKRMGLSHRKSRLTNEPYYNISLGSYYLNMRLGDLDGSYILAIASYNAGIGNVTRWIKNLGDPRKLETTEEIIDWMEQIPFSETQNYVQRVLENLQLYRYILDKGHAPIVRLSSDLKR